MADYTYPQDVTSPKGTWELKRVLYDGGVNSFSIAEGDWDGHGRLAIRWNNTGNGYPVGRKGVPIWFLLPEELREAIFQALPPPMSDTEESASKGSCFIGLRTRGESKLAVCEECSKPDDAMIGPIIYDETDDAVCDECGGKLLKQFSVD